MARTLHMWVEFATAILIIIPVLLAFSYFPSSAYPWIKAMHVIAIISWLAGMLYLPRLFVYHCDLNKDPIQSGIFKTMEQRLLRYIINPGSVLAWITGLWMAWKIHHFHGGWLYLKLCTALLLSAFHGFLVRSACHFFTNRNQLSQKHWRALNEVPTLLMIVAIIAVIVKIPA